MSFTLPTLPYSINALADRGMCQETLELHHGKHHQTYVTALNGLVEKNDALKGKSLEELVKLSHGKEDLAPVFNNAGNGTQLFLAVFARTRRNSSSLEQSYQLIRRCRSIQATVQSGGWDSSARWAW